MSTEEAEVVSVGNGVVVVRLEGGLRCMTCSARGACQAFGTGNRQLELPAKANFRPGERVVLRYKSQSRVLSALVVFLIPIGGLVGGFAAGVTWFGSQGAGVLGAFVGLVLGFGLLKFVDRIMAKTATFLPQIVEEDEDS